MTIEVMKRMLTYSPDTGTFQWTSNAPHKVAGKPANSKDHYGYIRIKISGKFYKAHQLAWAFTHGEFPNTSIDHINGIPDDNKLCNLRLADHHMNMQNQRRARKDNFLGVLGVSRNGSKYRAEIRADGKKIFLGNHATQELAHQAYIQAKRKYHKGCTL